MKTAIFLVGGVLIAYSLYLSEAATLYHPGYDVDISFDDIGNSSNILNITNATYPVIPVRLYGSHAELESLCVYEDT